jgi:hypothetical protein
MHGFFELLLFWTEIDQNYTRVHSLCMTALFTHKIWCPFF